MHGLSSHGGVCRRGDAMPIPGVRVYWFQIGPRMRLRPASRERTAQRSRDRQHRGDDPSASLPLAPRGEWERSATMMATTGPLASWAGGVFGHCGSPPSGGLPPPRRDAIVRPEAGGGRDHRQPGQVRKEAALTTGARVVRQPLYIARGRWLGSLTRFGARPSGAWLRQRRGRGSPWATLWPGLLGRLFGLGPSG